MKHHCLFLLNRKFRELRSGMLSNVRSVVAGIVTLKCESLSRRASKLQIYDGVVSINYARKNKF